MSDNHKMVLFTWFVIAFLIIFQRYVNRNYCYIESEVRTHPVQEISPVPQQDLVPLELHAVPRSMEVFNLEISKDLETLEPVELPESLKPYAN